MPDRVARIEEVFSGAAELPPAERDAFLTGACGGDRELRREVEALLAADRRAGGFLEPPPTLVLPEAAADPRLGQRIGAWELTSIIASGGMGIVYEVHRADGEYHHRAALKLVRESIAGSDPAAARELLERFRNERQVLAALDHPGIAKLIDGGTTEDGRPYLVMEYVAGQPIDRYCRERRLELRARIELFRQVCTAVHAAHQRLIVHRDLKPTNILVTENGMPRLVDFGIAKLLQDGTRPRRDLTRPGSQPMTPGYASPEQVRGEPITTATDVYALGVLLYELSTGQHPYQLEGVSVAEVVRRICEQDPPPPSAAVHRAAGKGDDLPARDPGRWSRLLAGDLDMIVLRALHKDPAQRFASAEQLGADLQRHLDGLPVLARPDTVGYRTRKFVRRHRAGVAAAVLVAVALLGGTAISAWYAIAATRAERQAKAKTETAERVRRLLVSLFSAGEPFRIPGTGEAVSARVLLDRARARVRDELADEPGIQAELLRLLGTLYHGLGQPREAEPLLRDALALLERAGGSEAERAACMLPLAAALHGTGQLAAAEELLRGLLARRRGDGDHPEVVPLLWGLALTLFDRGRYGEAVRLHEEAVAMARRVWTGPHPGLATAIETLAACYENLGRSEDARPLFAEALAILRSLHAGDHLDTMRALHNLANSLGSLQEWAPAEERYAEAERMAANLLDRDHPTFAALRENRAALLIANGRLAEALALQEEALAIRRKALGSSHQTVARNLDNLGFLRECAGDPRAALVAREECVRVYREVLAGDHPELADAQRALAAATAACGEAAAAEPLARAALAMQQRCGGRPGADAPFLRTLSHVLVLRGELAEGRACAAQALAAAERHLPAGHDEIGLGHDAMARALLAVGDATSAQPHAEAAQAIWQATRSPDHEWAARSAFHLGWALRLLGEHGRAADLLRQACDSQRGLWPAGSPALAETLDELATALAGAGEAAGAAAARAEARAMRARWLPPGHPLLGEESTRR